MLRHNFGGSLKHEVDTHLILRPSINFAMFLCNVDIIFKILNFVHLHENFLFFFMLLLQ